MTHPTEKKVSLTRVSTIDALTMAMKQDIFNGRWMPGTQITEQEIVERYSVSRHSVREAFLLLVNQGYLEKRMNVGVFTRVFTPDEIKDLYIARGVFEQAAVEALAKKRFVPRAVEEAMISFKKHTADDPWSEVSTADLMFHRTLVESLDCERIRTLFDTLMVEFELINKEPSKLWRIETDLYNTHESIVSKIRLGDAEGAKQGVVEHLAYACSVELSVWK